MKNAWGFALSLSPVLSDSLVISYPCHVSLWINYEGGTFEGAVSTLCALYIIKAYLDTQDSSLMTDGEAILLIFGRK